MSRAEGFAMGTMKWSEDYVLNIPSLDNEHKLLVSLINDMALALLYHGDLRKKAVNDSLQRLSRYIRAHFESEERFLMFNNYPDFNAHKEQHELLLDELGAFERKFKAGDQPFNSRMLLFLKDWLVRHIILHDCKFAVYYNDKELIPIAVEG